MTDHPLAQGQQEDYTWNLATGSYDPDTRSADAAFEGSEFGLIIYRPHYQEDLRTAGVTNLTFELDTADPAFSSDDEIYPALRVEIGVYGDGYTYYRGVTVGTATGHYSFDLADLEPVPGAEGDAGVWDLDAFLEALAAGAHQIESYLLLWTPSVEPGVGGPPYYDRSVTNFQLVAHIPTTDPEEYVVDVSIGDHDFTVSSLDDFDADLGLQVLDGLKIWWGFSEAAPQPAQPNPVQVALRFWALDTDQLADVELGTPFSFTLTNLDGDLVARFDGRVAQMLASPLRRANKPPALLYSISGVDYTVDLKETPITGYVWPEENAGYRWPRIVEAAAAAGVTIVPPPYGTLANYAAVTVNNTNLGAILDEHLATLTFQNNQYSKPQRYIVVPVVVDGTLDRFECALQTDTVDSALLPGTFDVVDDLFTLVFPDDDADGMIPAGLAAGVELASTWTKLKYRAVNDVTVTSGTLVGHAARDLDKPRVRLSLTSNITHRGSLALAALLYLPQGDVGSSWAPDPLRLHASRKPAVLLPSWFPDHTEDPANTDVYAFPFVVDGIAESINLAGRLGVYAGELASVALTVAKAKFIVDFALRRQLPLNAGADAASCEWVLDTFPTITPADVDPDLTCYEARLARRTP